MPTLLTLCDAKQCIANNQQKQHEANTSFHSLPLLAHDVLLQSILHSLTYFTMGDPNLSSKGSVPKGQWFNNTEPLVICKNLKHTQPLRHDEMSHQKYNPRQVLFVKSIPQYSASHVVGLFTQFKPLEVKNFYPQSGITTFMVTIPTEDVARMALDVTDGLGVDSTIIIVEPYNAKQSTVARREARKRHNGSYYDNNGDHWNGYEADREVQDDQPATEERAASSELEEPAPDPTRKIGIGISWANAAQGKVHEQPSPSPATPTVTAPPNTIDVPTLTHLRRSNPTEEEVFAALDKDAPVDRSGQFSPLMHSNGKFPFVPPASAVPELEYRSAAHEEFVNHSSQYSPSEHDIGAKARFLPPLRGTFTSPSSEPTRPASAQGHPAPAHRLPVSTPYPNGPPGFASERTRFPPPGFAPSLRSPFTNPPSNLAVLCRHQDLRCQHQNL